MSLALTFLTWDMDSGREQGWGQNGSPLSLGHYVNRNIKRQIMGKGGALKAGGGGSVCIWSEDMTTRLGACQVSAGGCAQTPQGSHPGRAPGAQRQGGGAGRICPQDSPMTRTPVHTVDCTEPEKAVAPKKCHGAADGSKTAGLSKEAGCKHPTA